MEEGLDSIVEVGVETAGCVATAGEEVKGLAKVEFELLGEGDVAFAMRTVSA